MQNEPLLNYAHDGIQQFDNPIPGWWKWIFVASIVFSVFYAMYIHIGAPGRSIVEKYDTALAFYTRLQLSGIGDLEPTPETIMLYANKKKWLRVGQSVFRTNCATCHGRDGEGKVGPNLTDQLYKNVRKVEDIARIISEGAGNGAMPAWAKRLSLNEVVLVASYVASLRGNPTAAKGKAPEGHEIPAWPDPPVEQETPSDADTKPESN